MNGRGINIISVQGTGRKLHNEQLHNLYCSHIAKRSQLSGIALAYGLDYRGFESRQELEIFLFTTAASRPALGPTQPPIQWVAGILSLGLKRPHRETHHSPPSSAEVKNAWSYTSTPPYTFMVWWSVKAQGPTLLRRDGKKHVARSG
jgi:hypothetical protein